MSLRIRQHGYTQSQAIVGKLYRHVGVGSSTHIRQRQDQAVLEFLMDWWQGVYRSSQA